MIGRIWREAVRRCPLCGGGEARPFRETPAVRVARCPCGFAFASAVAREEAYDAAYFLRWGMGSATEGTLAAMKRTSYGWVLDRVAGAGSRGGRLLDIGCALGYSVEEALARGYDAQGVEPAPSAAAHAARRLPGRITAGTLESARFPGGRFDVVTLIDVIEHVADPLALLRELARVTAPGGRLALTTPDLSSLSARAMGNRWPYLIPEHLGYFGRETLARALGAAGWRLRRIGPLRKCLRAAYVRAILRSRGDGLGRAGAAVLAGLPPGADIGFFTGDLVAVAQKG
jgi:2-polyprenyl-3-methyl-5-hydroxy-6-metoxy-1,4-benzoquinol methylase